MKDILINYPIKFLQQELINVRTGYRLEKKRITEILKTMKSIKKLEKEQIIDLLIKHNYDISKLPKLEDLEKPKKPRAKPKEKKPRGQPKEKKETQTKINEETQKRMIDLYGIISKNLKDISSYSLSIYQKPIPYFTLTETGYIYDIKEAEKKIRENPRLINIKKELVNKYKYLEEKRNLLNNTYDDFIKNLKEYYELSPYRFNFLVASITMSLSYDNYIQDLLDKIFEGKKKGDKIEYNDEFNNYIFKIGEVRVKEDDFLLYNTIIDRKVFPSNQRLVIKEISLLISKFLLQFQYDNIQDFYDNNRDLFIPNINLYQKFIKEFKLMIDVETFITDTKEKYNYNIIQNFEIKSNEKPLKEPPKVKNAPTKVEKPPPKVENQPPKVENKPPKVENQPPKVENPPPKVEEALNKVEKIEPILLSNKNVRLSSDDFIKFRENIRIEPEKTIRELFNRKLTLENILSILDIGKTEIKFFNAFFTPMKEIDKLIDMSGIQFDNKKPIKILETSAGIGNIIIRLFNRDFNNKYNYKVDCYEINQYFYQIGKVIFENIKNVKWYYKDFLKEDIQTKYNYVFTNPPFNIKLDGKTYNDVDFLNKSYSLLEDGGRLCAIISVGYKSNSKNPTYKKFNESLKKIMDIDNSFVKTEEIQGFKEGDAGTTKEMKTGINMVIMTIVKVPNLTLL